MRNINFIILLLLIVFSVSIIAQNNNSKPIADSTKQMIIVIAAYQDSSKAILIKYERKNSQDKWRIVDKRINVIVGKRGLAWGSGLHGIDDEEEMKQEGDYKSPEGVFSLSKVFGFSKSEDMQNIKMPYIHITKMLECVDDKKSKYYNQIIERDVVDSIDWSSSEKMIKYKTWYDFGVVVDHNRNPIKKGCGSCIFLHYWEDENDITSGCTAMEPKEMDSIIYWLDADSYPILVQLSKEHYVKYKNDWHLPELK